MYTPNNQPFVSMLQNDRNIPRVGIFSSTAVGGKRRSNKRKCKFIYNGGDKKQNNKKVRFSRTMRKNTRYSLKKNTCKTMYTHHTKVLKNKEV